MNNNLISASDNDKWSFWSPKQNLAPTPGRSTGSLSINGGGKQYCIGCFKYTMAVLPNTAYKFKVRFRTVNLESICRNVMNLLCWIKENEEDENCAHDHISSYKSSGDHIEGEDIFISPDGCNTVEIQLGGRYLNDSEIIWDAAVLEPAELPERRIVRVSAVGFVPYETKTLDNCMSVIDGYLKTASAAGSDIVVLPEFTNKYDNSNDMEIFAEKIPEGRFCRFLSESAASYGMNICAGVIEADEGNIFNTGIIFDRKGNLAGKYRKTHLYWPESFFWGECPGDEFPVFDIDIGRVGIMICYDNWYGEVPRLFALKGAEVLLYPNEGHEEKLMAARAIDNRVYIASASIYMCSSVTDTRGNTLASAQNGVVTADIDLNDRKTPYPVAGGTLNSSPGGRRSVRNSISDRLYSELSEEIGKWENLNENFCWNSNNHKHRISVDKA